MRRRAVITLFTACAVLGQHRSTQRKTPRTPDDEAALTAEVVELAKRYGRYGYTGASPRCCGTPGGP